MRHTRTDAPQRAARPPRPRKSTPGPCRLVRIAPLLAAVACSDGTGPARYDPLVCGHGSGGAISAAIGAEGGTVTVGGHSLTVPANAVSSLTTFRITEVDAAHVGVEVEPHGQRFSRNATLTLSFARCGGHPAGFRDLRIVEVRRGTTDVIRVLPTVVDSATRTVRTDRLDHLSGYLVGTNRSSAE